MSIISHYETLLLKHDQIHRKLRSAYLDKNTPDDVVTHLKKQRLIIKEELVFLRNEYPTIKNIYKEDCVAA
jgi:hypothetical protein